MKLYYYVQSVHVINTEDALYILRTQWLYVHVLMFLEINNFYLFTYLYLSINTKSKSFTTCEAIINEQ